MVYEMEFRDLLEIQGDVGADSPDGNADLGLTLPSYIVRSQLRMHKSSHDILEPEEMHDFIEFPRQVMALGAHGHVSCP